MMHFLIELAQAGVIVMSFWYAHQMKQYVMASTKGPTPEQVKRVVRDEMKLQYQTKYVNYIQDDLVPEVIERLNERTKPTLQALVNRVRQLEELVKDRIDGDYEYNEPLGEEYDG